MAAEFAAAAADAARSVGDVDGRGFPVSAERPASVMEVCSSSRATRLGTVERVPRAASVILDTVDKDRC